MPVKNMQDEVTQDELTRLADLQASVHEAQINCSRMALMIEKRVKAGAPVECGPLGWDKKLRMARSRKDGNAKEA